MVAAKPARYLNVFRAAACGCLIPLARLRGADVQDSPPQASARVPGPRRATEGTRGKAGRDPRATRGVPADVAGGRRASVRGGRVLHPPDPDEGPGIRGCGARPAGTPTPPCRGRPR